MRTQEARQLRDKAVSDAIALGHSPLLLTHSGAMELWVCENGCNAVIDAWDSPAIVNGRMAHIECKNPRPNVS
jgi:hypothetical protein